MIPTLSLSYSDFAVNKYEGMNVLFTILLLLLGSQPAGKSPTAEEMILGDWCAGSKSAFHEGFSLSIENGERLFESWLHQRPAESGTWELRDKQFTIHGSSGQEYAYTLVSITSAKLVLRQRNKEPEVYVREGCLEFESPTKD